MQEQKSYRVVLLAAPDLVPIVAHVVSTVGRVVETVPLPDGRQEVVALCDRLEAAAAMLAGPGERAEIVGPPRTHRRDCGCLPAQPRALRRRVGARHTESWHLPPRDGGPAPAGTTAALGNNAVRAREGGP